MHNRIRDATQHTATARSDGRATAVRGTEFLHGPRSRRRILLASAFAAAGVLLLPTTALAHAGLISASPRPGSELDMAPAIVILRFSEPLNEALSGATITGPDGRRSAGQVTGPEEISVRLSRDARGAYRVSWTSVSLLDGHTLSGSFGFGVGVPVGFTATDSSSPQLRDILISIARAIEDIALMLGIGLMLLGRLARRAPALGWIRRRPAVPLAIAFVAGTVVVSSEALAAAQGASLHAAVLYLTTGLSGLARLVRPASELLAFLLAARGSRWTAWPVAGAIVVLAASGHSAATNPRALGVLLEMVHVGTAALWAGGIMALVLQHPPEGWRGEQGRVLLGRFTPVALGAFLITSLAGALRGAQELGSLHELVSSSYGDALLVKGLFVAIMAGLSMFAWRRRVVMPRFESAMAVGTIAVAALLAAYPLPPARLADAQEASRSAAQAPGLPQAGDLTLGGRAGNALVGVTVRPAKPGRNDLYLYAMPFGGEEVGSQLPVELTVDGQRVGLEPCGMGCLWTVLDLSGGERIQVRMGGPEGGLAAFELPSLPAPDGGALFSELERRMHGLDSYRLAESLDSGTDTIRTSYECRAPNECRARSSGGFQTVWIGGTLYLKTAPHSGWIVQPGDAPFRVSSFLWDYVPDAILDPRIVGSARVGGVHTSILAFYGPLNSAPYWFRLWVDPSGLVWRAEMSGYGHFMDERYSGFDSPIKIRPPEGTR